MNDQYKHMKKDTQLFCIKDTENKTMMRRHFSIMKLTGLYNEEVGQVASREALI